MKLQKRTRTIKNRKSVYEWLCWSEDDTSKWSCRVIAYEKQSTKLKIITLFKEISSISTLSRTQTKPNAVTKQMPNQARKTSVLVVEKSIILIKNCSNEINMQNWSHKPTCEIGALHQKPVVFFQRGAFDIFSDSVTLKWMNSVPNEMWLA